MIDLANMGRHCRLIAACLAFAIAGAASIVLADDTTAVLLPSYATTITGVNGTKWSTDSYVVNTSDHDVPFGPCVVGFPPGPACPPLPLVITARSSARNPLIGPSNAGRNGVFVLLRAEDAPALTFSVRLLRNGRAVADLPVVPVAEFRSSTLRIVDIPVGPAQRTTLRIFGLLNLASIVRIRTYGLPTIFSEPISAPLMDTTVSLAPASDVYAPGVNFAPSYFELSIANSELSVDGRIWIEISAMDGAAIWAYVTSVSNTSDQVLVLAPK